MNIIVENDKERVSSRVIEILKSVVHNKPNAVVVLPGGNTTLPLYAKLAKEKSIFEKIRVIQLDEIMDVADEESFREYLNLNVIKPLKIPKENFLSFSGKEDKKDLVGYSKKLKELGGIDIVILGLGLNGHIGFNEPGSSVFSELRNVTLQTETVENLKKGLKISKNPEKAITLGIRTILKSKKIILIATGDNKSKIVSTFIKSQINVGLPASTLKNHPDFTFIADKPAMANIKSPIINDINILTKYPESKVIAVISPHPDDSAFSAGGTIALLSKTNLVYTIILTSGYRSTIDGKNRSDSVRQRKNEALSEGKVLNSKILFENCKFYNSPIIPPPDVDKLTKTLIGIQPDVIILPQKDDFHPTHKKSYLVSKLAIKKYLKTRTTPVELWHYETPWRVFNVNEFNLIVPLSPKIMAKKIEAISKHKSQIQRTPFHYMAKGLSIFNAGRAPEIMENNFGKKVNFPHKFAELFDCWRVI